MTAPAREAVLGREGWERRFVTPPERLFEHVALYNALGFEVRIESALPAELEKECAGCRTSVADYRVIYTRRER